jgi:hypothetical protein
MLFIQWIRNNSNLRSSSIIQLNTVILNTTSLSANQPAMKKKSCYKLQADTDDHKKTTYKKVKKILIARKKSIAHTLSGWRWLLNKQYQELANHPIATKTGIELLQQPKNIKNINPSLCNLKNKAPIPGNIFYRTLKVLDLSWSNGNSDIYWHSHFPI